MWQTNNVVFALDQANGVLYAGGSFTEVRPPGSDPGQDVQPQAKLAAFDSVTGEFLAAWRPQLDGTVFGLDVSPDGSRLYAVGDFQTIDGVEHKRIAAFSLADPRLPTLVAPTEFTASASSRVYAVRASADAVYIGGNFAFANGTARTKVAALALDGSLLPFAPVLTLTDGTDPLSVLALAVDADRVFVAGMFDEVNGIRSHGLEAVDPVTGANTPGFETPYIVPGSAVTTVLVADGMVYIAGHADKSAGRYRLEGVMAMDALTGAVKWGADGNRCMGDSFALAIALDTLWVGTHAHRCGSAGSFPESDPKRYLSVLGHDPSGGTIRHFFPDSSGNDSQPGSFYNVRALATDGQQLFVGGGFARIGERAQQSLTRFTSGTPTALPERASLSAGEVEANRVELVWETTSDRDDSMLTYRVIRQADGSVVKEKAALSLDWRRVSLSAIDHLPESGDTVTYVLETSDRDHVLTSQPLTIQVP